MNYEQFKKMMIEEITKIAKANYPNESIELGTLNKPNDIVKDSITLHGDSNVTPTLYLDDMFQDYKAGKTINEVIDYFFDISLNERNSLGFNPEELMKWENAKDRIIFSIVGEEFNQNFKEDSPYRVDNGNMFVYYVDIENNQGNTMRARITNNLVRDWGVHEGRLYELAMENTPRINPLKIERIEDGFYILTNDKFTNGAASMYYPGVLDDIAKELGSDLHIIPSSVHEVIVIPTLTKEPTELDAMVRDANATILEPEEILGNKAFIYNQREQKLSYAVEPPAKTKSMAERMEEKRQIIAENQKNMKFDDERTSSKMLH